MFFSSPTTSQFNVNNDAEAPTPPTDAVSCISWSPQSNIFVATAWDKTARCYEVTPPAATTTTQRATVTMRLQQTSEAPLLTAAWCNDGARAIIAGCNNRAMLWALQTNQITPVAQHEGPIKYVFWMTQHQLLGTASWDKSVRFWDLRTPQPSYTLPLSERCYWGDHSHAEFFCLATADKRVYVYDTRNPSTPMKTVESPLKYQTRCVCSFNFNNHAGFVIGSIEGRCGIQYIADADKDSNFTFKCHRENNNTFAVNEISFHPVYGTFATCGSDGTINFWDKDSRQRLKGFPSCKYPITCGKFNRDGNLYAYGVGYDWHKGHEYYKPTDPNAILVHISPESEIKNKPRQASRR